MNHEHRARPGTQGGRETRDASLPEPFAYTIEQAMILLNCDRRRVYLMISDGTLRTYKHGRRRWASAEALRDAVRKLERAAT